MVFSAKDRILIKELPESGIWGKLQDGVLQLDSWCGSAEVTPKRRVGTIPAVGH